MFEILGKQFNIDFEMMVYTKRVFVGRFAQLVKIIDSVSSGHAIRRHRTRSTSVKVCCLRKPNHHLYQS